MKENKIIGENEGSIIERFDIHMRASTIAGESYFWHNPQDKPFHIVGLAWFKEEKTYRRMPMKPSQTLPEAVDHLANHTAGGQIRFRTNSKRIAVRVKLAGAADMTHMPQTGQCGVDCYIGEPGEMVFCGGTNFPLGQTSYEVAICQFDRTETRQVTLNLPLYMGVEEIAIGLEEGASVTEPSAYVSNKKVIIYGTSITQGGCANRPGMAYPNILSRRIPLEFINLGFSGSGRSEPEVAHVISEIDNPACLVIDAEANCQGIDNMKRTLKEFVRIYREAHPHTLILLMSQIPYASENVKVILRQEREERKAYQMACVEEWREQGDSAIYFIDGSVMLGSEDCFEGTVDGVHPTDLGFKQMADYLTPILRSYLLV